MPFAIKGRIDGLQEVFRRLDAFGKKVRRKAIRAGIGKAGQIVLKAAKGLVRRQTGLLRKSLGRKVKMYAKGKGGIAVAIVGPRTGFKQEVERQGKKVLSNPTKYAHLVELGTKHSAAFPFLKPAYESNKDAIKEAIANEIQRVISEVRR